MCMFCAAIPAALAVGAKAQAKQRQQAQIMEPVGKQPPNRVRIPAAPATAVVVTGLAIAAIWYHTQA